MYPIVSKTGLPPLSWSIRKIKNRVANVDCVKSKEAFVFLQNGFSKVSLGCTSAIQGHEMTIIQKRNCPDAPGSGTGKSGSGRIGSVGKFGDINEEQFFYKKNQEQIERLKLELQKKGQEKSKAPEKKEE